MRTVAASSGATELLRWGLLLSFTKERAKAQRPINCRSDTVATSGMFRSAFAKRRCIVPAGAFYEWKAVHGAKQPYAIARQDQQPMVFAGLWEGYKWPDGTITRTFTILTTNANATVPELHDRMPVILEQKDWPVWLGEGAPAELLRPAGEDVLRIWPVSRAVNSPRNNGPELLTPIGEAA